MTVYTLYPPDVVMFVIAPVIVCGCNKTEPAVAAPLVTPAVVVTTATCCPAKMLEELKLGVKGRADAKRA